MATRAALVEKRENTDAERNTISKKSFSLLPTSLNRRWPSFPATPLSSRDSTMMIIPSTSMTLVLEKQAKASLKSRIPVKIRASMPMTVVTATENFSVRYKTQVQAMMIKVMVLSDIGAPL